MNLDEIEQDGKRQTGQIANCNLLANRMFRIEQEIATLEEELKAKKASLYNIETKELPDEMDACGLKEFTMSNGQKIVVESIISASLPSQGQIDKADEDEKAMLEYRLKSGLKFLRMNGADSLIKNVLKLEIDKGKDNVVQDVIKFADELGIAHKREEKVHAQTLNKYIKERIRDGLEVPNETFSVYSGRIAYIVKPKTRKGEK